jgi:hypothetical protein
MAVPSERSESVPVTADDGESIGRVGRALAGRYVEIGQEIAARIVDEIPGYRDLPPDVIADLRAGATATVELLARTFAEGSTIRRENLGFLRELAARRSHQGVSLEVFIHAYRVALLAYWDACADEASRLGISQEACFKLARSAIEAIDIITTQAAEAYLREETRLRTQSGRAARDLLERLIHGQPTAPGRRHPAAPGLDPTGQLLTVVGTIQQTPLAVGDALQLARDTLEENMSLGTARPLAAIRHRELVLSPPEPRRAPRSRACGRHANEASTNTTSTSATASASHPKASRAFSRHTAKLHCRCRTRRRAGRSSRSKTSHHWNAH